ncbi:MAG: SatD family protein [Vagococcus sp.]
MYIAIIGDIIESKKLENRNEVQRLLMSCLDEINSTYYETIKSKFTITLGDEFQGLCVASEHTLEIIDRIKFKMAPVQIRFGIGIGEIQTEINPNASIGADGPAYWKAREAIELAHLDNDISSSRTVVKFSRQMPLETLLNHSLRATDYIESRWRATQYEVVKFCVLDVGYSLKINQSKLAKKLNISNQAVNQRLKSSGYSVYIELKQDISRLLIEGDN